MCVVWQMGRRSAWSAQSNAVGREEGSTGRRSRTQNHDASTELNGDHRGEGGFETRSWPAQAYPVRRGSRLRYSGLGKQAQGMTLSVSRSQTVTEQFAMRHGPIANGRCGQSSKTAAPCAKRQSGSQVRASG